MKIKKKKLPRQRLYQVAKAKVQRQRFWIVYASILPNIAEDLFVWRKYLGSYLLCKISEKEASAD